MKNFSRNNNDLKVSIINTALEFLASGDEKFSLRDIAKTIGVSHAAPYKHFKNKEEIMVEIAIDGFIKLEEKLIQSKSAKSHHQYFMIMGKEYLKFAKTHPNHYQLMFSNAISDHSKYPRLRDAGKKCFAQLLEMVMNLQRANFVIQENPLTLAFHIWSSIHGLSLFKAQNKIQQMEKAKNLEQYSTEPLKKWSGGMEEKVLELCLQGIIKD